MQLALPMIRKDKDKIAEWIIPSIVSVVLSFLLVFLSTQQEQSATISANYLALKARLVRVEEEVRIADINIDEVRNRLEGTLDRTAFDANFKAIDDKIQGLNEQIDLRLNLEINPKLELIRDEGEQDVLRLESRIKNLEDILLQRLFKILFLA